MFSISKKNNSQYFTSMKAEHCDQSDMFEKDVRKRGFTVIEIVIVIAIISILTLLAVPNLVNRVEAARLTKDIADIHSIEKSIDLFLISGEAHVLGEEISQEELERAADENKLVSRDGVMRLIENGVFREIPAASINKILLAKDKIDGIFYANEQFDIILVKQKKSYSNIKNNDESVPAVDINSAEYQTSTDYLASLKPSGNVQTSEPFIPGEAASDEYFQFTASSGLITSFYPTGINGTLPEIKDLVIPESISGVAVSGFTSTALKFKNLNSIYFPAGIKAVSGRSLSQTGAYAKIIMPSSMGTPISASNPYALFYGANIGELVVYKGDGPDYLGGLYNGFTSGYHGGTLSKLLIKDGVQTIPGSAFSSRGLTELFLGKDIKTIGSAAFAYNQLTEAVFPDGLLNIGGSAFKNNPLARIYLPEGVNVGAQAFSTPTNIESAVIPDSISNGISASNPYSVFANSTVTKLVIYPGAGGNSLAGITKGFTSGYHIKGIKEITIVDGVDKIPGDIFSYLGVENLNLGKGIVSIGSSAFRNNSFDTVYLDDTLTYIGHSAFYGNPIKNLSVPAGANIAGNAFGANVSFVNVRIPDSISNPISPSNANAVFRGSRIENLTIYPGDGENSLAGVFRGYTDTYHVAGIMNITILDGVDRIPGYAFSELGVTTLNLGKGLVNIGAHAFRANSITEIYLDDTVTYIGASAFISNPIEHLRIPPGANVGPSAFAYNSSLIDVRIPDSMSNPITSSNPDAVFKRSRMVNLTIYKGDGTPSLAGVFRGYTGGYHVYDVNNIIIESAVTNIPSSTFSGANVKTLSLGENLSNIGGSAFRGNQIQHLIIPESVTVVGSYAFHGNPILDLSVPSAAVVGENTFGGNSLYQNVRIPDSLSSAITASTPYSVFSGSSIEKLNIYKGAGNASLRGTFIGYTSGYGAISIKGISIDEGVASIASGTINVPGLHRVELPSGVSFSTTSLSNGFPEFYNSSGLQAGIYERTEGVWVKK